MAEEGADVVVIGGGIAGASVAWHLVSGGAATTIIDRRDAGRATDAGAGILSPETTRVAGDAWAALAAACGRYYPEMAAALTIDGEDDTGFGTCGLLAIALADWDIDAFEELAALASSRGAGVVTEIGADDARARFPALGAVRRALWHPGAARVDGRRFGAAVLASAGRSGLSEVRAAADRVVVERGRVVCVEAGGRTIRCGAVVIAGGAWSPAVAAQLGVSLPISPERGQIAQLRATHPDAGSWPIVLPALGHYLVPFPGGRVAAGATREGDAGFAVGPTVAGVRQVLNEVARVAPGLVDAELLEVRVGFRPACADGLPVLGRLGGVPNAYVATGYGADGLLLSPWCGRLLAAWVLGGDPDPALEPFLAARFTGV